MHPTRGNNILDLILASSPNIIENVNLHPPPGSSDHNMLSFFLTNIFHCHTPENTIKYDFFKADYTLINAYLMTIDWSQNFSPCIDTMELYSVFFSTISYILDSFVPLKYTSDKPDVDVLKRGYIRQGKSTGINYNLITLLPIV